MSAYLRNGINASCRGFLVFAQRETLNVRELDFVGAEGFCATRCQQRWIEEAGKVHVIASSEPINTSIDIHKVAQVAPGWRQHVKEHGGCLVLQGCEPRSWRQ